MATPAASPHQSPEAQLRCEEMLRNEVRNYQQLLLRLLQWGVTLIASLQTAVFFIRREMLAALIEANKLPKGTLSLPWKGHLIGTLFVCVAALMFSYLTVRTVLGAQYYREQLKDFSFSGIKDLPIADHRGRRKFIRIAIIGMFWVFPVLDTLFWVFRKKL
jgi:hypothetical protein